MVENFHCQLSSLSQKITVKQLKVDDHDTSIYVVPDGETLTEGTWKVVVRNVSDDVGNTAETLVKNNFVVEGGIPSVTDTGFRVRWIVAVPNGKKDPIAGGNAASDIIYVKFNRQIKTYGGAANAGATTNYTVNGYTLPTSKIDAFIDNYNKPASNYGYSDIVAIHLKATEATLTDSSNTININKTLESAAGVKLTVDNDGKYLLSKVDGTGNDINGNPNYIFTWKYNDYVSVSGAETDKLKASDVQKLLDDENYNTFEFDKDKIDTDDLGKATINLTHSGTVDFDGLKVKELIINTMETGILDIKNVQADKVTVYAPYADVRLNGVKVLKGEGAAEGVGTLEVKDILAGTLTLSDGTVIDDLKVTDPNEGKIRLEGDAKVNTTFVIDTKGDITLDIADDVKLPKTVDVNQACKIIVEYGTVKFKIADGVKGSDLKIISENGAKVSFEGSTPDGFNTKETTDTVITTVASAGSISGTVVAATSSVIAGKVDGAAYVTVTKSGEANKVVTVPVKDSESSETIAKNIAAAINGDKIINKIYTAKAEGSNVIITAVDSENGLHGVSIEFKSDKVINKEAAQFIAGKLSNTNINNDSTGTAAEKVYLKDVYTYNGKDYKLSYKLKDADGISIDSNNVLTVSKDSGKGTLIVTVTYNSETARTEFSLSSIKDEKGTIKVTISAIEAK